MIAHRLTQNFIMTLDYSYYTSYASQVLIRKMCVNDSALSEKGNFIAKIVTESQAMVKQELEIMDNIKVDSLTLSTHKHKGINNKIVHTPGCHH